jgi:hypothetical protein
VRQPVAEVVGVATGKHLRFVLEAAEGASMDDTVAVTLEGIAIRVRRLGITSSARLLR